MDGVLEVGGGDRQVGCGSVGPVGSVEADGDVDVDDAAGLELHDFGVGDLARLPELGDGQTAGAGEGALQGDVEPAPQLGGVPLPDHVPGVVVAVDAQRGAEPFVVVAVAGVAPQRTAVRADRLVATGPEGSLVPEPVHRPE